MNLHRRHFLTGLGALAAGFALNEATGLVVPRKKMWFVGEKLERPHVVQTTPPYPWDELLKTPQEVNYVFVDQDGKEFRVTSLEPINGPEPVLERPLSTVTLKFDRLKWAVTET